MNITLALIWFAVGFILVNGLKTVHLTRSEKNLLKKMTQQTLPPNEVKKRVYTKSLPYFPLYYLLVWLTCGAFYFLQHTYGNVFRDALMTGIFWWFLTLILEILVWIKANHSRKLTWKEMFIHSQPWISLSYYAVLISPIAVSIVI